MSARENIATNIFNQLQNITNHTDDAVVKTKLQKAETELKTNINQVKKNMEEDDEGVDWYFGN